MATFNDYLLEFNGLIQNNADQNEFARFLARATNDLALTINDRIIIINGVLEEIASKGRVEGREHMKQIIAELPIIID